MVRRTSPRPRSTSGCRTTRGDEGSIHAGVTTLIKHQSSLTDRVARKGNLDLFGNGASHARVVRILARGLGGSGVVVVVEEGTQHKRSVAGAAEVDFVRCIDGFHVGAGHRLA